MTKAQADIVSAVIIVIIALGLMSSAYMWGFPLIQKRQDTAIADRTDSYFNQNNANSLPNVIESIANNGGEKTFSVNTNGIWILDPDKNYIEFTFLSKVSKFAVDTAYPISLTLGAQCTPQPSNGTLGLDKSSVVCVQASQIGDRINVTYRIWFRELYENPYLDTGRGYKIQLEQADAGILSSTNKEITISFSTPSQETINGKTLITKEIKILLI
jgi:hypothetical protein